MLQISYCSSLSSINLINHFWCNLEPEVLEAATKYFPFQKL